MNLRKKIAQMLIMGFSGFEVAADNPVREWLSEEGIGGVILFDFDLPANRFGKNIKSCEQIKLLNHQLRECASLANPDNGELLIAVDYEGGAIDRLRHVEGCKTTLKPIEQAALSDQDLFREADSMANTLRELGFNLNFAPVVDLNITSQQGIIGKLDRSFSANPYEVVRAAEIFVKAFTEQGILCCYKHFPGHGSAIGDTHEGFVDVSSTFQWSELEPYKLLLNKKNTSILVMTAHVINRLLDETALPATLSKTILTGLLRNQMEYDGVIISDDLQMRAIADKYSLEDSLALTINAGADMLIFGNQLGSISASEIIDTIESLVKQNVIPISRIEDAYQRILNLKNQIKSEKQLAEVVN